MNVLPNTQGQEWNKAHKKLKAYYGLIGMKPLGDKYVARWNGYFTPDLRRVCPHLFK